MKPNTRESVFKLAKECINSRKVLKGLLLDLYKGRKIAVNVILAAFDSGIIKKINATSVIDSVFVSKCVKSLTQDFALSDSHARAAVKFWIVEYASKYLGKEFDVEEYKRDNSKSDPDKRQEAKPPVCSRDEGTSAESDLISKSEVATFSSAEGLYVARNNLYELNHATSRDDVFVKPGEIYTDGIGQIHFAGGMVRFDFMLLQPGLEGTEPIPKYSERIIMPPLGFLGAFNSMQQLIDKLVYYGVLVRNDEPVDSDPFAEGGAKMLDLDLDLF